MFKWMLLIALCASVAAAQERASAYAGGDDRVPATSPDARTDDTGADEPPRGDIVTLKDGKVFTGQIVRQTATYYILEVLPGVEMPVLRSLVDNISYDNYSGPTQSPSLSGEDEDENIIHGRSLSSSLTEKLIRPISESSDPLMMPPGALASVLKYLADQCEVRIDIDVGLRDAREAKESWQPTIPPGATLSDFLDKQLPKRYPQLSARYEYNSVTVYKNPAAQSSSPTVRQPTGQ